MMASELPRIGADTSFLYALIQQQDLHHERAVQAAADFDHWVQVTTDGVLAEFLAKVNRKALMEPGIAFVEEILAKGSRYIVVEQDRAAFHRGLKRYKEQGNRTASLVDCMLIDALEARAVTDILTFDNDFREAGGFRVHPEL